MCWSILGVSQHLTSSEFLHLHNAALAQFVQQSSMNPGVNCTELLCLFFMNPVLFLVFLCSSVQLNVFITIMIMMIYNLLDSTLPLYDLWNSVGNIYLKFRPAGEWMSTTDYLACRKPSRYVITGTDSPGEHPVLMLSLWLYLQCSLQSVSQAATPSSRTPTVAPPSAPAGCSSRPCRTSSVTTPSFRAGTSFRYLTNRPACPRDVWR